MRVTTRERALFIRVTRDEPIRISNRREQPAIAR